MTMNRAEARRTIESLNAVGSPVERWIRFHWFRSEKEDESKIYNAPPGFEMNPVGYAAELRALRAEVARMRDPALPADADAAFDQWVRNVPLHERTPRNVWHAAAAWKGASNAKG